MKIEINLYPSNGNEIRVPRINLHVLQSFVYSLFSEKWAAFLHSRGYEYEGRRFKLFAFSWPKSPKRRFDQEQIIFGSPMSIVLSSPVREILEDLASGALVSRHLRIGNNVLQCSGMRVIAEPELTVGPVVLKALSPITCYSTLYKKDGSPYTVFHSPFEEDFQNQIHNNLVKKFRVLFPNSEIPEEEQVRIKPIGSPRLQVARFRKEDSRPIKGWWGKFVLEGPAELLRVGIDSGLGAKNSGGWGCVGSIHK